MFHPLRCSHYVSSVFCCLPSDDAIKRSEANQTAAMAPVSAAAAAAVDATQRIDFERKADCERLEQARVRPCVFSVIRCGGFRSGVFVCVGMSLLYRTLPQASSHQMDTFFRQIFAISQCAFVFSFLMPCRPLFAPSHPPPLFPHSHTINVTLFARTIRARTHTGHSRTREAACGGRDRQRRELQSRRVVAQTGRGQVAGGAACGDDPAAGAKVEGLKT